MPKNSKVNNSNRSETKKIIFRIIFGTVIGGLLAALGAGFISQRQANNTSITHTSNDKSALIKSGVFKSFTKGQAKLLKSVDGDVMIAINDSLELANNSSSSESEKEKVKDEIAVADGSIANLTTNKALVQHQEVYKALLAVLDDPTIKTLKNAKVNVIGLTQKNLETHLKKVGINKLEKLVAISINKTTDVVEQKTEIKKPEKEVEKEQAEKAKSIVKTQSYSKSSSKEYSKSHSKSKSSSSKSKSSSSKSKSSSSKSESKSSTSSKPSSSKDESSVPESSDLVGSKDDSVSGGSGEKPGPSEEEQKNPEKN